MKLLLFSTTFVAACLITSSLYGQWANCCQPAIPSQTCMVAPSNCWRHCGWTNNCCQPSWADSTSCYCDGEQHYHGLTNCNRFVRFRSCMEACDRYCADNGLIPLLQCRAYCRSMEFPGPVVPRPSCLPPGYISPGRLCPPCNSFYFPANPRVRLFRRCR